MERMGRIGSLELLALQSCDVDALASFVPGDRNSMASHMIKKVRTRRQALLDADDVDDALEAGHCVPVCFVRADVSLATGSISRVKNRCLLRVLTDKVRNTVEDNPHQEVIGG